MYVKTADHFSILTIQDKQNLLERLHKGIDKDQGTGCWEWTKGKFSQGYGQIKFRKAPLNIALKCHRLMYQLHHRESFDGYVVRHLCNNRKCCNPFHLKHGSPKENTQDSINCGSHPFYKYNQEGCSNFASALSEEQIQKAKSLFLTGDYTHQAIADKFEVCRRTIGRALDGTYYSNLNPLSKDTVRFYGKRLTKYGAKEILAYYNDGKSIEEICLEFNKNRAYIQRILRGERFTDVYNEFCKQNPSFKY